MKRYTYNVMLSIVIDAENEDQAREMLDNDEGNVFERDVMLIDEEDTESDLDALSRLAEEILSYKVSDN